MLDLDVRRRVDMAGMECSAAFSRCGSYRYELEWRWDKDAAPLLAWMLNPSTADHEKLDRTVEGLMRRAAKNTYLGRTGFRLPFGGVKVINLFAFRATDPADMMRAADPVGPLNDRVTRLALAEQERLGAPVLCGWGTAGRHLERQAAALAIAEDVSVQLSVLRINRDGTPGHPLYIGGAVQLGAWVRGKKVG